MPGRVRPGRADPDDWFADVDLAVPVSWEEVAEPDSPAAVPRERASGGPTVKLGTLLAGGAVVLVVAVLAGLALGGVFSGDDGGTAATTTTQSPTTTASQPKTPTTKTLAPQVAVPAPTATLKPGDSGSQVKVLQRALKSLGYSVGKVDGDYGATTEAALVSFQKHTKLTADGVFGAKTLAALKRALATTG